MQYICVHTHILYIKIMRPRFGSIDGQKGEQDEKITDARLQREEEEKKVQAARYPDENEKQWTYTYTHVLYILQTMTNKNWRPRS